MTEKDFVEFAANHALKQARYYSSQAAKLERTNTPRKVVNNLRMRALLAYEIWDDLRVNDDD